MANSSGWRKIVNGPWASRLSRHAYIAAVPTAIAAAPLLPVVVPVLLVLTVGSRALQNHSRIALSSFEAASQELDSDDVNTILRNASAGAVSLKQVTRGVERDTLEGDLTKARFSMRRRWQDTILSSTHWQRLYWAPAAVVGFSFVGGPALPAAVPVFAATIAASSGARLAGIYRRFADRGVSQAIVSHVGIEKDGVPSDPANQIQKVRRLNFAHGARTPKSLLAGVDNAYKEKLLTMTRENMRSSAVVNTLAWRSWSSLRLASYAVLGTGAVLARSTAAQGQLGLADSLPNTAAGDAARSVIEIVSSAGATQIATTTVLATILISTTNSLVASARSQIKLNEEAVFSTIPVAAANQLRRNWEFRPWAYRPKSQARAIDVAQKMVSDLNPGDVQAERKRQTLWAVAGWRRLPSIRRWSIVAIGASVSGLAGAANGMFANSSLFSQLTSLVANYGTVAGGGLLAASSAVAALPRLAETVFPKSQMNNVRDNAKTVKFTERRSRSGDELIKVGVIVASLSTIAAIVMPSLNTGTAIDAALLESGAALTNLRNLAIGVFGVGTIARVVHARKRTSETNHLPEAPRFLENFIGLGLKHSDPYSQSNLKAPSLMGGLRPVAVAAAVLYAIWPARAITTQDLREEAALELEKRNDFGHTIETLCGPVSVTDEAGNIGPFSEGDIFHYDSSQFVDGMSTLPTVDFEKYGISGKVELTAILDDNSPPGAVFSNPQAVLDPDMQSYFVVIDPNNPPTHGELEMIASRYVTGGELYRGPDALAVQIYEQALSGDFCDVGPNERSFGADAPTTDAPIEDTHNSVRAGTDDSSHLNIGDSTGLIMSGSSTPVTSGANGP